ncbi:MAG: Holliday junction branch migration DNA helicase RuvB [SAR202 cluster bacterium]|nr:Holliday junction branch migration DNA helicase RuvB [SAR202 cluster bacterium]
MTDRVLSGSAKPDDVRFEGGLRPRTLGEYVGQEKVKDNLRIAMQAAKRRGEPLDHVLLYGPPGLGKTTLAHIIASEMGANIRVTAGPAIERTGDMAAVLTQLAAGDVLFIDEIHRLGKVVEEILYPAMEDFNVSWMLGKGLAAQSANLRIEKFTLVGATTRFAMVSPPLRDRFGTIYRLDFYDVPAMESIVQRSAEILAVPIEPAGVSEIARRARGTPRVANRLLRRVRDYAQVRASGVITGQVARDALRLLEVDNLGLDEIDHRLLRAIAEKFDGGPVGLETIAASIGEESDTIMDVYEPFLLQLGFLNRTPRGRTLTRGAYAHLGVAYPSRLDARQVAMFDGDSNAP